MRTATILASTILVLTTAPCVAQSGDETLDERYEKAFHTETGARDPHAALAMYEKILAAADEAPAVAARALLRMGFCHLKLGQPDQAIDAWKGVLIEHDGQSAAAAEARAALRDMGGQTKAPTSDTYSLDPDMETTGLDTILELIAEGAPLSLVLMEIANDGEISLVIDPQVLKQDVPLNVELRNMTLRQALDFLARLQGFAWDELHEAVYFGPSANVWSYRQRRWVSESLTRPGDAAVIDILQREKLNLNFVDTPLEDVFSVIGKVAGLELTMTVDAMQRVADRRVTMTVHDGLVGDVLRLLVLVGDLEYRHRHGVVVLDVLSDPLAVGLARPTTLEYQGAPLSVVVEHLAQVGGVAVVLGPEATRVAEDADRPLDVKVEQISVRAALTLVTKLQELDFAMLHGVAYVDPAASLARYEELSWPEPVDPVDTQSEALFERLKTVRLEVNFQSKPLREVVRFLCDRGKLRVVAECDLIGNVTLVAQGLSLEKILRLALMPHGLTYSVEPESVLIRKRP